METFKPFLAFAKTNTNIADSIDVIENETQVTVSTESDSWEHTETEIQEINVVEQNKTVDDNNAENPDTIPPTTPLLSSTPSTSKAASRKRTRDEKCTSSVDAVISYLENKRSKKTFSPTDMIFLGYSETIQTFSPRRQAYTKIKIAEIIAQQECLHLEESTANNCSQSRPSSVDTSYVHTPLTSPLQTISFQNERNTEQATNSSSTYTTLRQVEDFSNYSVSSHENIVDYVDNASTASFFKGYIP